MYQRYRKDVEFFVVYIGEAHPSDAWQVPSNIKDRVVYASPTTENERSSLAGVCVTRLGIKLPALVDGLDDATEKAYAGWPDRLYLVGRDGRIVYKTKPGPFGFKPADLEAEIRKLVPVAAAEQPAIHSDAISTSPETARVTDSH
jgi:type I thyroxine 5'-deiodinase